MLDLEQKTTQSRGNIHVPISLKHVAYMFRRKSPQNHNFRFRTNVVCEIGGEMALKYYHETMRLNSVRSIFLYNNHSNIHKLSIGEFPWVVAIIHRVHDGENIVNVYKCAGSLIHPSVRFFFFRRRRTHFNRMVIQNRLF